MTSEQPYITELLRDGGYVFHPTEALAVGSCVAAIKDGRTQLARIRNYSDLRALIGAAVAEESSASIASVEQAPEEQAQSTEAPLLGPSAPTVAQLLAAGWIPMTLPGIAVGCTILLNHGSKPGLILRVKDAAELEELLRRYPPEITIRPRGIK